MSDIKREDSTEIRTQAAANLKRYERARERAGRISNPKTTKEGKK